MPHSYCPCGVLLSQCSTVRPLKSPCLRLFVSIKTAKCVTPETKICNACRTAYYTWKNNYPEFGNILTRIEVDLSNNEAVADKISVIDSVFILKIHISVCSFVLIRLMQWRLMKNRKVVKYQRQIVA